MGKPTQPAASSSPPDRPATAVAPQAAPPRPADAGQAFPADPLLLASVRLSTFDGPRGLTNASGFFFEREERLYLVSSRHVFIDEEHDHHPDRLELELHGDRDNLGASTTLSVLLYANGRANWRQGRDEGSEIDVAVLPIARDSLPEKVALRAFTLDRLARFDGSARLGEPLLVCGFPLGFHDALHHVAVVRQGVVASPYGWRFQGNACFVTDARTHRGISGAAVVARDPGGGAMPWILLGIHSSRLDIGSRDLVEDESLGLNVAWYPDILVTLTEA